MSRTFEVNDLLLLGYQDVDAVPVGPDRPYMVIDAAAYAGLGHVKTRFIYLKSGCTAKDAREAVRGHSHTATDLRILQPASGRISQILGYRGTIEQLEDLVWRKLVDQYFNEYLSTGLGDDFIEKHFIPPTSAGADGSSIMPDLQAYLAGRGIDGGLRVILADAGVGKTTVSRKLVGYLAGQADRTKTIPVYVEASHWRGSVHRLGNAPSVYDVIKHSLELQKAKPVSEEILKHALKQGYLSFVFDGFDELCGHHKTAFDPLDVFKELDTLSQQSARILLTSRTGFWEARRPTERTAANNVVTITLKAFNDQQARGYLRSVFGQGTEKYKRAEKLHKSLRTKYTIPLDQTGSVRDEVFNLPFCVRLLADYVKDGGSRTAFQDETLGGLLGAICEREQARQELVTKPEGQINSFVDVALAYVEDQPTFAIEDLLALPEGGFEESDQDKISAHALVRLDAPDSYRFRYEFLAPYLRARGCYRSLSSGNLLQHTAVDILQDERNGEGKIFDNLSQLLKPKDFGLLLRECHRAAGNRQPDLACFFLHLALRLSYHVPTIQSDQDRTKALFFGDEDYTKAHNVRNIEGWSFWGTFEHLDLRKIVFKRCLFTDVRFRGCEVGRNTAFDECTFQGILALDADWKIVDLRSNCRTVYPADTAWEKLGKEVGNRADRADKLLEIALGKFWYSGTFRGSIQRSRWNGGWLGEAGEAKRVLNSMLKAKLLSPIPISSVTGGGYAFDRESLADLQNFMDNRQKSGKIRVVFDDLSSS